MSYFWLILQAPIFVEALEGPRISRPPFQNSHFCYEHCRPANGNWSQCSSLFWHPSDAVCTNSACASHYWLELHIKINDLRVRVHDRKAGSLRKCRGATNAEQAVESRSTQRSKAIWSQCVMKINCHFSLECHHKTHGRWRWIALIYHSHIFSFSMSSTPQDEFIRILELGDKLGERPSWERRVLTSGGGSLRCVWKAANVISELIFHDISLLFATCCKHSEVLLIALSLLKNLNELVGSRSCGKQLANWSLNNCWLKT